MTTLTQDSTILESLEKLYDLPAFEESKGCNLLFWDDNKTSFEYVVILLTVGFEYSSEKAFELTNAIHNNIAATVFQGSREACEEKLAIVHAFNKKFNESLYATVEDV